MQSGSCASKHCCLQFWQTPDVVRLLQAFAFPVHLSLSKAAAHSAVALFFRGAKTTRNASIAHPASSCCRRQRAFHFSVSANARCMSLTHACPFQSCCMIAPACILFLRIEQCCVTVLTQVCHVYDACVRYSEIQQLFIWNLMLIAMQRVSNAQVD